MQPSALPRGRRRCFACWVSVLEVGLGGRGEGGGWFFTSSAAAALLTQAAPFFRWKPNVLSRWLLPQLLALRLRRASVGAACREKQLLRERLVITDGKRKGKYLCVTDTI